MKRLIFSVSALLSLVALSGCNLVSQKIVQSAAKQLQNVPGASSATIDSAYIAGLTPLKSGPGLIVAEPVVAATLKDQVAWGAGASRWLQVQVSGLPEIGKTPLWGVTENGRRQLKLPNLQVSGATADKLGRACGVTHVATATLDGTPSDATLAYRVRDVATGKTVGTAQVRGSLREIHDKLPSLAKTLAATLNVKAGTAPRIALSPDELKFLGTPPLKPGYRQTLPAAQQARLKNLVAKDALAGVMAQRWCDYPNSAEWQKVADTMTRTAPRNALIWAEVAYNGPIRVVNLKPRLAALQKQFPNNYLLCEAGVALERGNRARPLEISWAEKAARAAPQSSYAWIDLAIAVSNAAQDVRRSRYSNQVGLGEWGQLNDYYARWQAAALQATKVDAGDTYAWSQLAKAATFNGDGATAEAALQKALTLDPNNDEAWSWGLEMYQPKWSDGSQFVPFVQRAASAADRFYFPAESISNVFYSSNQQAQWKTILQTVVAKDARNDEALAELGAIYHYRERRYNEAEKLYRRALASNPQNGRAMSYLGDLTYWVHNDPKGAFDLYQAAIAANPRDGYFHANLGRMLALTGRKSAGIAEAKIAKQLGFDDASHPVWAATGVSPR